MCVCLGRGVCVRVCVCVCVSVCSREREKGRENVWVGSRGVDLCVHVFTLCVHGVFV